MCLMNALTKEIFRKDIRSTAWFLLTVYSKINKERKKNKSKKEEIEELNNIKKSGLTGFEGGKKLFVS